jgi:hypothetical protein
VIAGSLCTWGNRWTTGRRVGVAMAACKHWGAPQASTAGVPRRQAGGLHTLRERCPDVGGPPVLQPVSLARRSRCWHQVSAWCTLLRTLFCPAPPAQALVRRLDSEGGIHVQRLQRTALRCGQGASRRPGCKRPCLLLVVPAGCSFDDACWRASTAGGPSTGWRASTAGRPSTSRRASTAGGPSTG